MLGLIGCGIVQASSAPGVTVLLLGDSLSAAYGISRESSWPEKLRERLEAREPAAKLINASISGETSAGGLARLPALIQEHAPDLLLLELGANDGLRGLSTKQLESNLRAISNAALATGAPVLLFEMRIPSNYGRRYTESFVQVFHALANSHEHIHLQPFFLADIALDKNNFLADGIHPNAAAQSTLIDTVWPQVQLLLPKPETNTDIGG